MAGMGGLLGRGSRARFRYTVARRNLSTFPPNPAHRRPDLAAPARPEPARLWAPSPLPPLPTTLHTSPRPGLPYPADLPTDSSPLAQSGNRPPAAVLGPSRPRQDLLWQRTCKVFAISNAPPAMCFLSVLFFFLGLLHTYQSPVRGYILGNGLFVYFFWVFDAGRAAPMLVGRRVRPPFVDSDVWTSLEARKKKTNSFSALPRKKKA